MPYRSQEATNRTARCSNCHIKPDTNNSKATTSNSHSPKSKKMMFKSKSRHSHRQLLDDHQTTARHSRLKPSSSSRSQQHYRQHQEQQEQFVKPIHAQSVWLWQSDNGWERFHEEDQQRIAKAVEVGSEGFVIERGSSAYFLNLAKNVQVNLNTEYERAIIQVKSGSEWLVKLRSDTWEPCSKEYSQQLEAALFEGKDFCILHGKAGAAEACLYADLSRWTLTDLATNTSTPIRIATTTKQEQQQQPQLQAEPSQLTDSRDASSQRAATSRRRSSGAASAVASVLKKGKKWRRKHQPSSDHNDSSSDANLSTEDEEQPENQYSPLWQWCNEYGTWSSFDDDTAATLESSWTRNESTVFFQRGATTYLINLMDLTQTNLSTGYSRPIQRGLRFLS